MKKLMSKFDIFSCSPVLRAEGESQVMNLCGSLFSILIFGFFTYIFFNNIISTVQLQNITSSQTTETVNENNKTINNVVVGVGLQWMSLVDHQHVFQLSAFLVNKAMNLKQINVFPCTREVWKDIDDSKFENLALDHHMCVEKEQIQLFGQNGAPSLQSLYLRLSICDPLTSPVPCANSTYITNFLATQKIWSNRFFACSLAVLDVGFNPSNQNPITYTVYEKTMWLLFNFEQQIVVQMFLGTYNITTDTNFMPVTTNQQISGYFVSQAISGTLINSQSLPVFVQCFIFTSPINFIFERTYGKLDEVLSYVGGLYGILISFFAFFLMSFNQYRYQLRVSEGAFSFKEGYLARQSDLHFGKYLKYAIYDWVKTLFCYQINWRDCKAIDEARAQAIEQIDIKHLLKRISHLQKINSIFVNSQVETALYLAESNSIQQVKHRRNIVQYCEKFTQLNKSITISVYQQANALFQFANNLSELNQTTPNSFQTIQIVQYKELEQFESLPSLKLMNQYCSKYAQKFKINNNSFNLTQQDIDAQQEITQSFYALQESIRMKLIKKIPLGILYRIRQSRNSKKSQKNEKLYKTEVTQQNKTMNLQRNRKNRIINSYDTNMNLDLKF